MIPTECPDDCQRRLDSLEKKEDDLTNPKDGALSMMSKRVHGRVDTVLKIVIATIVTLSMAVTGYIYAVDQEQDKFAIEEEVKEADVRLEQKIENLRVEIKHDLKETEVKILEAIREIKND